MNRIAAKAVRTRSVPSRSTSMRCKSLLVLAAISLYAAGLPASAQNAGDAIPGQYLIQLKSGANAAGVTGRHGLGVKFVFNKAAHGLAASVPPGRLAALQNDPDVLSVS